MKSLVVFDLDGTLAPSKGAIDPEMGALLAALLGAVRTAVISGGAMAQFQTQLLAHLPPDAALERLSLLPTCGTRFYRYTGQWDLLYAEDLTADQKRRIVDALEQTIAASGFAPDQTWGNAIEDRESQITYSALGQQAPHEAKVAWDPDFVKRKVMKTKLNLVLPEFSIRLGGSTSIDVTLPGIDKAYGIRKLCEVLKLSEADVLFIGDALFPDGNDAPARTTGATCIQVRDPEETKRVIEAVTACAFPRQEPPPSYHL